MLSNSAKLHSLLKSSLFCYRFEVASANCVLSWRRFQSRYNTNLSSRDFVEAINQKAKIHRYLKLQEPEENDSEYDSFLETRDSEQNLNVITESDQFDFGALSAEALSQEQVCHESLVSRTLDKSEHKSVIDELLTTDPEEDPADRLRLSKVNRRHPPEYYSAQIIRFCKAGDTYSALSVFFTQMLETDRVQPSRFHFHMLLDGLAKVGDSENAFRVYEKMTDLHIPATQATYSRLFRSCAEDISTWYRKYKHFIPPIVNHPGNSSLSLLQRKNLALQKALTPDMLPKHFGGPAVNKVYSLWRRLKEKEIPFTDITYNSLILALAKAGDIHGCLRALDMMMTKSISPSSHGSMKSQKRLTPDSFTLASLLSAIEPANMKRNLILCHNNNNNNHNNIDKDALKQSASNENTVFRFSPFQLAIILWHDLLPYTSKSLVPHHFTLLANIMALQNNCLDSNHSELIFVKNTQCKSFQDLLKYDPLDSKQTVYLPIHPSCTSSELATLMISQASQLSSLSTSNMPSSQENPLRESTTVQKTSDVNHLDWENTMLALASPINVLLPTDKPIVICGPKNQSLAPWQRLALVGGLHGFIDVIENHYKLKPGLPFMTSLVRLLPSPNKLDDNNNKYENDFDLWEKEFLSLLPRFKLRPDTGIYNALINRRTSAGVSPSHLLAEMTRQGLFPDQITWGCLARGCETVQSVERLLNAFKIASMPSSSTPSSSMSSSNESLNNNNNNNNNNNAIMMNTSIQRIHSPVIRPSFTFFSTLLTTSEFNWELKTFIIEYMMQQAHIDELSDKNKQKKNKQSKQRQEQQQTSSKNDKSSNQYNGYVLDRRLIASLEIDISLFRELLVKGVIPKDGSPVPASETGGFYVPRHAIKSFYRFIKVYKSWLRETPVEKPC